MVENSGNDGLCGAPGTIGRSDWARNRFTCGTNDSSGDAHGRRTHQSISSERYCFYPFRFISGGDAGHIIEECFLLHAT